MQKIKKIQLILKKYYLINFSLIDFASMQWQNMIKTFQTTQNDRILLLIGDFLVLAEQ